MPSPTIYAQPLDEFAQEPLLTVASVLLIVVAIGWIIVSRLVSRNLRRTAAAARRARKEPSATGRDIWAEPPG